MVKIPMTGQDIPCRCRLMVQLSLLEVGIMTEILVILMIIEVTCACINMTRTKILLIPSNPVQPLDLSDGTD